MLEGIETGYEEKFDFPERSGPPALIYTLASVPRTGSTFVSHLLWQSGCLGSPLEYLNFLPGSPFGSSHNSPEQQRRLWHTVLRRRTSPNGVFGVKCFSQQLRGLQQQNPSLLLEVLQTLFPPSTAAKVVTLKRRDRVAHAVSYARAAMSGVWRKEQEQQSAPNLEYSAEIVEQASRALDQQEADWDLLFRERGAQQILLWYEDVLDDPRSAIESVADFLGIALDRAAAVRVPEIERQSQQEARRWTELHASRSSRS
jgi:LPS sulfotransferase NodH